MLHFVNTSLLSSESQTVVNTVNTVGVMGKGLAKHFASKYPRMFEQYKDFCANGMLTTGKLWLWKAPEQWVLNFPTKKHWRHPSKLEYIEAGLKKFVEKYEEVGITEISFPRLGCGNGGLDWSDVKPLMESYLTNLPITIYVHDFQYEIGAPEHKANEQFFSKPFVRSYEAFLHDLRELIVERDRSFKTINDQTLVTIDFVESDSLKVVLSDGQQVIVPNESLYDAWQMLLKGPVTSKRLIGDAQNAAPALLGFFATLPYARAIQLRKSGEDEGMQGVELLESLAQNEQLVMDN